MNLGRDKEQNPIPDFLNCTESTIEIDTNHPKLIDYKSRIEFLEDEAKFDDIELSKASMYDFCSFIKFMQDKTYKKLRIGSLFLMDNGDLSLLWADDKDSQVDLQFLGYGALHYVIFGRHLSEQQITHEANIARFEEIKKKIDRFDLDLVLYE